MNSYFAAVPQLSVFFPMPLDVKSIWDACGEAFDRYTTADDSFAGNIERPAVEKLIGNISGARVLDVGCGSGTYSVWFAKSGAQVTGLDLSPTMISLARNRASASSVQAEFQVADIRESLPFREREFDLVFTATALHYVENLNVALKEIARVISPGGCLVASVLHPMSTARFPLADSDAIEGPDPWEGWYFGSPARSIETPWLKFGEISNEGRRIFCHHHTVSDYFNALGTNGLTITDLLEPAPPAEFAMKNITRYDQAIRTPVFLILKAQKPT
ncbi:MAG: class I SAM-dependent methyltransferase [Blastocatellia bacterium]